MRKGAFYASLLASVALIALVGCSGSTAPVASPPPPSNISGDYIGTMQDAQGGSGTVTATLAQTGSTAGGTITDKETGATLSAQISLAMTSSDALSGSIVIDYASGTTCTFSTTGTYNASTAVLSGSYTAVTNCGGDSGTYSLTQQCTDTITSGERRRMVGGVTAC